MKNSVFDVTILLVVYFILFRITFWQIKDLYLSNNGRKKRKKNQTFKEWLFYTRYKNNIPSWILNMYYITIFTAPVLVFLIGIVSNIEQLLFLNDIIIICTVLFHSTWMIIVWVLSWRPGRREHYHKQWVSKPRKRKKK